MKDDKNIFPYNCERKEEFIKKGIGELNYYYYAVKVVHIIVYNIHEINI